MSFKNKGYVLIRDFIPEYLSNFLYSYIHLKKKVFHTLRDQKIISPYNLDWGSRGDTMMPNTFSLYGDTPLDALLAFVKEKVEKKSGLKLNESYSYARIYEKGDVLKKHVDRKSCAVSVTLNLGGDSWPFYLLDKNNIKIVIVGGKDAWRTTEILINKNIQLQKKYRLEKSNKTLKFLYHYFSKHVLHFQIYR